MYLTDNSPCGAGLMYCEDEGTATCANRTQVECDGTVQCSHYDADESSCGVCPALYCLHGGQCELLTSGRPTCRWVLLRRKCSMVGFQGLTLLRTRVAEYAYLFYIFLKVCDPSVAIQFNLRFCPEVLLPMLLKMLLANCLGRTYYWKHWSS